MAAKRVAPHDRVINEKRKTDLLAVNHQICFLCTDNLSAEIFGRFEENYTLLFRKYRIPYTYPFQSIPLLYSYEAPLHIWKSSVQRTV